MQEMSTVEDQNQEFSLRQAVLICLRRQRLFLTVYTAVLAIAAAWLVFAAPTYRAAAKVLLSRNRIDISTSPHESTQLAQSAHISPQELNSELEILRSRTLVRQVLDDLQAEDARRAEPGSLNGDALGQLRESLREAIRRIVPAQDIDTMSRSEQRLERVLKGLEVTALPKSNVIELAFAGAEPAWARTFVNRLTEVYGEQHAQLSQVTAAEGFFTQQSEILRQKLTSSEAAFGKLRQQAAMTSARRDEIEAHISEFSAELARTIIARAELEERMTFLKKTAASDARAGRVATPELLALEAQRAELLGRYRPDSQRVRETEKQIRALRAAIASYDRLASSLGASGSSGPVDLFTARAALAALTGKEAALRQQLDEYRRQAATLDAQRFDLTRLERQVKLDEEAYLSYVRTAEESRLSNALEQAKILRLRVIEWATLPVEPITPDRPRVLWFALAGGLVLAVGAAFAREYLDPTLKTAADVRTHSNLEVLAVLQEHA
jgi:uncharacterized protein involved in exopolysaccharide biosynthesis